MKNSDSAQFTLSSFYSNVIVFVFFCSFSSSFSEREDQVARIRGRELIWAMPKNKKKLWDTVPNEHSEVNEPMDCHDGSDSVVMIVTVLPT